MARRSQALELVHFTSECWLWTGPTSKWGYGYITEAKRPVYVHRLFHEELVGPIPDGYQVDHLCRVRNCVNPDHLEAVTPEENVRRENTTKTHCPQGHAYDTENTYTDKRGRRQCKECSRERTRAWREKNREQHRAYMREYRAEHLNQCREATRRWRREKAS